MTHLHFVLVRDGFQELVPISETTPGERLAIAAGLRAECLSTPLEPGAVALVGQLYRTLRHVLAYDAT